MKDKEQIIVTLSLQKQRNLDITWKKEGYLFQNFCDKTEADIGADGKSCRFW